MTRRFCPCGRCYHQAVDVYVFPCSECAVADDYPHYKYKQPKQEPVIETEEVFSFGNMRERNG